MSDPLLPEEQQQPEDDNLFFDVAAAPFRGIEGAIQGAYNLADYATFDALPDYDERFLGRSSTMAGSFVEGVSQFMTGFVPIFGMAGRVGNAAKAGSLAQRVISGRGIAAGAVTDFTVFNGQEERLSNLIQQFPELQNPVTEFLAHDDEEGEIEGRLKNVLEGLGLEAIGAGAFVAGMKAIKKVRGVEDPVAKAQVVKDELVGGDELASISKDEELDRFYYGERHKYSTVLGLKHERDIIKMDFPVSVFGEDMNIRELEKRLADAIEKEDFTGEKYSADSLQFYLNNANEKIKKRMDKYVKEEGIDLKEVGLEGADLSNVHFEPKLKELDFKDQDLAQRFIRRSSPAFGPNIDDSTLKLIREGFEKSSKDGMTWETISPKGKPAPNVENVLNSLSKNADLPEVQALAKNLKNLIKDVEDKNVIITLSDELADPSKIRGNEKASDVVGKYSLKTDRITLFKGADEQTVVHEILHGVTAKKINAWVKSGGKDQDLTLSNIDNVIKNRQAPKPIRELASSFKEASDELNKLQYSPVSKGESLYAFKDLDEFLVAAFTDYDLQKLLRRMPSNDRRTIFQKIVDSVKDLLGYTSRADGSLLDKVLRDSAQIISAGRPDYIGKARLIESGRYSIKASTRSLKSDQLSKFREDKNLPEKLRKDGSHPTQIATTTATYKKIKPLLNQGKTMDFGAGKNISSKAGIKSDTYEPFPEKGFNPTFSDASEIPEESYDNVINNAVLNVVPQDIRDGIVKDIGRILKPGGKGFINVRGKDVFDSKHTLINKENTEVIVNSSGAYQKGFTENELADYLEDILGEGFQVRTSSKEFGTVSAVITKQGDEGLASVKNFASEVSPEYRGIAKQIAEGAKISLPRFETTDQQHSFIEALREEVKNNPTSMAKMEKEAAEGLPVDFGDNDITDRMAKSIADQKQVRLEATVYKRIGTGMVKKLLDIAQEYRDAGGGDVATAKLKNAFQEMVSFSEMYWKLGRESSLALGIRRQGNRGRRKIGLNSNEMTGEGIRKNFVNENGGMSTEKIIKAVEEIEPEDLEKSINGMFKLSRKTQGRKFLDMPSEYWINSILSGPRTHMVNIIGNGLTTAWTNAEMMIGGVLTGNMEVTKQTFASWADMTMLRESMKFARKTWGDSLNRPGENLLDPDARAFNEGQTNAITPEAFGMKDKDRGYKMVNGIGNFLRIPTRLLMTSDEFFKQLNYRRAARFKLAMDGINKHQIKDPKQLAEFVEKGLEDVITSGGRHYSEESLIREGMKTAEKRGITGKDEREKFVNDFVKDNTLSNDKEVSALADFALEEARYLTFTKDLDKGSLGEGVQRLQQSFSPLRFILPFVRTPTNILAFAFERTPGVFMPGFLKEERKRLLEGYKSSDPIERSRAMGKIATSAALTAVITDTIINQRENITGGGPKNEQEKKALMATGWQPYSIRMNGTYYSYQRLDPFGTILGVLADLVDVGIREPNNPTQSHLEELFSAVSITFARNVTNKSYLAGVQMATDALSDPDRYASRLGRNLGSSLIPFSGFFSQTQSIQGDQEAREIRSMGDALLNKLPGGRTNLDPKRNILGESVIIENKPLVGAINPIAMTDQKNDVVLQEMADLKHAFRAPNSTYNGVIDLLEFTNSNGQTAHDRRLEKLQSVRLNGKTMRQALERLINSRNYQRLPSQSEPGFPSPRIREINRVLNRYRSEALEDTLKEFPELSDYYDQIKSMKGQYGSTYDHSDVLSLLSN